MPASVPGVPSPTVARLAPPDGPLVYRLSPGWRAFLTVFGVLLLVGGMAGMVLLAAAARNGPAGAIVPALGLLIVSAFGSCCVIAAVAARLVLDAGGIESRDLFTTRRLRRADIAGRQVRGAGHGMTQLILVPRDRRQRKLRIGSMFRTDVAFAAWLRDIPDLDAAAAAEAAAAREQWEAEVAGSAAFGATPAARLARLAQARRLVVLLTVIAGLAAAWCSVAPHPYLTAVAVSAALPWVAVLMVALGRGLIRLIGSKGDAQPRLAWVLMMCAGALAFRGMVDIHLLDWRRCLLASAVAAAVFLAIAAAADRTVLRRRATAASLLMAAGMYAYGVVTLGDVLLDHATPQVFRVAVLGRRATHGKDPSWFLHLAAWGPRRQPADVTVSPAMYALALPGQDVCVRVRPGALSIAWFAVVPCDRDELLLAAATALPTLRRRAAHGDLAALAQIGVDYVNGAGVPPDDAKARRLLEQAATGGNAFGAYALGMMAYRGIGEPRDLATARHWLAVAAPRKPAAALRLGDIYEQGLGVPRDPARALALYQDAARHGLAAAAHRLGTMYRRGLGVPADAARAFGFDLQAAREADPAAMNDVGYSYLTGAGVTADPTRALAWLRSAAAAGEPRAMQTLGMMLHRGIGTQPDAENAYFWLALAARLRGPGRPAPAGMAALLEQAGQALTSAERRRIDAAIPVWRPAPARAPARG